MAYSKKGRIARAELTEAAVRGIRLKYAQGASVRELVQEYDVGFETIRRIIRWETWRWVSDEGPGGIAAPSPVVPKELSKEDMAASLARTLALAGMSLPTDNAGPQVAGVAEREGKPANTVSLDTQPAGPAPSKPMPSMEESLAAAARESDEVSARVAQDFARKAAAEDSLLAGLSGPNGIQSQMTDTKPDGGLK